MDRIEPSQQPERASYHLFSAPAGETDDSERKRAWKGDAFSFRDVLDIINPLQHLPVISTLYRWITGDTIGAVPRMVGDGLYGGPIGFVAGLFNAAIKQESGKDVGEQVIALLGVDQSSPAADPIAVAAKDAPQGGGPQVTATATGDGASPLAPAGVPIAGVPIAGIPIAGAAAAGAMPGPGQPIVASAGPPPSSNAAALDPAALDPTALATRVGTRVPPALPAADADPRAAFLARTSALHRQLAGDNGQLPGRALSNKVVPLQGIALPAGLLRASASGGIRAASPGAASDVTAAPSLPSNPLPSNPPINISQQMMEALDKYTRLQQQRASDRDAGRGSQVDLAQ